MTVYDDFAHHPTAIALTLQGLRKRVDGQRILAVLEPRSNTMRMGVHAKTLGPALQEADEVFMYHPAGLGWSMDKSVLGQAGGAIYDEVQAIIDELVQTSRPGDHILIMSNGGFENIHTRLLQALTQHGRKGA